MSDKPLITIGITCFNAEETITRAVESAIKQTWLNVEVLIVDDASTDESCSIIKSIADNLKNVKVFMHHENLGAAAARNTIIEHANGDFIAFFDDDDFSFPERLQVQYQTILEQEKQQETNLILCYASGQRVYDNGYTVDLDAIGSMHTEKPHGTGMVDYLLLYKKKTNWFYGNGVPTCSLMARTEVYKLINGFDLALKRVEDVDFAIRAALKGAYFVGSEQSLFTQYSTISVDKTPEKNLQSEQLLVKKNLPYLSKINKYYYALNWPKLRYWHFKRRYDMFLYQLLGLLFHNPVDVFLHLLETGPRRFIHERRMRK